MTHKGELSTQTVQISSKNSNLNSENEIKQLKKENAKLRKEIVSIATNRAILVCNEAQVKLEYELDDTKRIMVGLSAKIGKQEPDTILEALYIKTLKSLENLISLTISDSEIKEE